MHLFISLFLFTRLKRHDKHRKMIQLVALHHCIRQTLFKRTKKTRRIKTVNKKNNNQECKRFAIKTDWLSWINFCSMFFCEHLLFDWNLVGVFKVGKIFESTNWMKRKSSIYQWRHNARLNEWMNAIFEKKTILTQIYRKQYQLTYELSIVYLFRTEMQSLHSVNAFAGIFLLLWLFYQSEKFRGRNPPAEKK